jgi:glycerol-3-phosphate cytidylyltransferase
MRKVITYGTFDLLHWGHIRLLERAKTMGDYLVVGLSTDAFNRIKHKEAYHSFEHRKLILEAIRSVDEVIPEHSWEQKVKDIKDHGIDLFVMGDDWQGEFDFLKNYCEVVYLSRTEGISTRKLRTNANSMTRIRRLFSRTLCAKRQA